MESKRKKQFRKLFWVAINKIEPYHEIYGNLLWYEYLTEQEPIFDSELVTGETPVFSKNTSCEKREEITNCVLLKEIVKNKLGNCTMGKHQLKRIYS
jgi:hypothetical protein